MRADLRADAGVALPTINLAKVWRSSVRAVTRWSAWAQGAGAAPRLVSRTQSAGMHTHCAGEDRGKVGMREVED